jgi:hypothetical protein
MTWRKKAQNRAYKDALRHTPGMPASPEEVIADAAASLDELPPETARLTMEQAQAWVAEHGVSGDDEPDDVVEGEYTTEQPKPANGQAPADPPGFSIWADWRHQGDAMAWGMSQGVFDHQKHCENAYAKVKETCQPKKASDMWQCWYQDVTRRIAEKTAIVNANAAADEHADGYDDIDPPTAGDWLDS